MGDNEYQEALKLGKKEYKACVSQGRFPYLPVLDSIYLSKRKYPDGTEYGADADTIGFCGWYGDERENVFFCSQFYADPRCGYRVCMQMDCAVRCTGKRRHPGSDCCL